MCVCSLSGKDFRSQTSFQHPLTGHGELGVGISSWCMLMGAALELLDKWLFTLSSSHQSVASMSWAFFIIMALNLKKHKRFCPNRLHQQRT